MSPGPISWTAPSIHARPEPASTKKISSSEACWCTGPGAAAGLDVDARHADRGRARRLAQRAEGRAHVADVADLAARRRPSARASYLTVPVLDLLDEEARLDPAQPDLARARVEDDVVGLAGAEGQQRQRPRRRRGRRARRRCRAGARRRCPRAPGAPRRRAAASRSPSSTTKISSSAAWQCGGPLSAPGATTRWPTPVRVEPSASPRSRRTATTSPPPVKSSAATSSSATMVGGRSRLGLGHLERAGGLLGVERVGPVVGQPVRAVPPRPRARQPGQAGVRAAAEGEHVEAVAAAEDACAPRRRGRCRMQSPARTA